MRNPWLELSLKSPYVLPMDFEVISRHNSRAHRDCKVKLSALPEPFIGNPNSATVVLLNLNPGHSSDDEQADKVPAFRKAILTNLRRKAQAYPFYYLNPEFRNPGVRWWCRHLRKLFDTTKLDFVTVARRLCVIEWFPYHSKKGAVVRCPSQEYSFEIAREALDSKLVVGMRSRRLWESVDRRFGAISYLKNP